MGVHLSKKGQNRHCSVTPAKEDPSLIKTTPSNEDCKNEKPSQKIIENSPKDTKSNLMPEDKLNEKSPKLIKVNSKTPSPVQINCDSLILKDLSAMVEEKELSMIPNQKEEEKSPKKKHSGKKKRKACSIHKQDETEKNNEKLPKDRDSTKKKHQKSKSRENSVNAKLKEGTPANNKLSKRMTLAPTEGYKSPNKMSNSDNISVNSFYSSLGSVNIENYYLHKKEKAFLELQKGLSDKGWDEDIVKDIVKLLRSYMDVEISHRNWVRCSPVESEKNSYISVLIEDNICQKLKIHIYSNRNLFLINSIMKNILNYQNLSLSSLLRIDEVTFRINRKSQIFYVFLSQECQTPLKEVFFLKSSEKKEFSRLEIENFMRESFRLMIWLRENGYCLKEMIVDNVYCCLQTSGSKTKGSLEYRFDLLPRFERQTFEKMEKDMDLASICKRNTVAVCSIAISLITMIDLEEIKKITSSKILLSFLKNNKTFHPNLAFFLRILFEDNLLGYSLDQTNSFFLECIENSVEHEACLKILKGQRQRSLSLRGRNDYLYYFKGDILYLYQESNNKTQGFRLIFKEIAQKFKVFAHCIDDNGILHLIFCSEGNESSCCYTHFNLENAQLSDENLRTCKEMFKILFSQSENKKTLDVIFSNKLELSFKELLSHLKLSNSESKQNSLLLELTDIFSRIFNIQKTVSDFSIPLQILHSLYDLANNDSGIVPIRLEILFIFDKFYFPGQIISFHGSLFLFGGLLKKFPSSFFWRLDLKTFALEKLKDLPFAALKSFAFMKNDGESWSLIWLSSFKKSFQVHSYSFNKEEWSLVDLKKPGKIDDPFKLVMFASQKGIAFIFTQISGFLIDIEKKAIVHLKLMNKGLAGKLFEDLETPMNFHLHKNSIKFLNFNENEPFLINLFLSKSLFTAFFSSLPLAEITFPLSMDKSLEKKSRKRPIILENKTIVNNLSPIASFPFVELFWGSTFFQEKEVLLVLSRKIDSGIENFDDVFEGAKKMLTLKHKNLPKIQDFYVVSMEILFLYKGQYENLLGMMQQKKKEPTDSEVFKLLYETVSALEYLRLNKMFFFEVSPKNIIFDNVSLTFKLINFEFETNISRNQFYFENRSKFAFLPPLPLLEDDLNMDDSSSEEEEKKTQPFPKRANNFTSMNLDIHKSNVYSLGLSVLAFATNNPEIFSLNNHEKYEKILEIIAKLEHPLEIKELLRAMLNVDEEIRWNSWALRGKMKEFKGIFTQKPDFSNLLDREMSESAVFLMNESLALRYSRKEDIFQSLIPAKIEVSAVLSSCYMEELSAQSALVQTFLVFCKEKQSKLIAFYQGSFQKNQIIFKKLDRPFFLENLGGCISLNLFILDEVGYVLGWDCESAEGVSFNRRCFSFEASTGKWTGLAQIPEEIKKRDDFIVFSIGHKVAILAKRQGKIKFHILDSEKKAWEVKSGKIRKGLGPISEKIKFGKMVAICVKNYMVALYDDQNKEIFLVDLLKFKITDKKTLISEEKNLENFGKGYALFYKNVHRFSDQVNLIQLGMNPESGEIFLRKKNLQ